MELHAVDAARHIAHHHDGQRDHRERRKGRRQVGYVVAVAHPDLKLEAGSWKPEVGEEWVDDVGQFDLSQAVFASGRMDLAAQSIR